MPDAATARRPRVIPPGGGRAYPMGRMRAVFKADREETESRYSISEWWLEPRTRGPGEHQHEDDHVYYVIAGVLSVSLAGDWSDAAAGSYILIPGGTPHDFQNRGSESAGFMTINAPGGFEERIEDIATALSAEDLRI